MTHERIEIDPEAKKVIDAIVDGAYKLLESGTSNSEDLAKGIRDSISTLTRAFAPTYAKKQAATVAILSEAYAIEQYAKSKMPLAYQQNGKQPIT